ncbi:MAG: hypothetical protein AAF600_15175 [Bacteroidota bacterium]
MMKTIKFLPISLIVFLTFACSEDDGQGQDDGSDNAGPLYAVDNRIFTPDGSLSYLVTASALDDASIDITDFSGLPEFPGSARVYGPEMQGVTYLTNGDPTITEVTFAEDGEPEIGRVISFAGEGVEFTSGGSLNVFLSPTKAYFVSQTTLEVVVWNPEIMEITSTFPLPLTVTPGSFRLFLRGKPIIVNDLLVLISYEWTDSDRFNNNGVTVTVVDTNSDAVVSNTVEERAVSFFAYAEDNAGNLYFIPDTEVAFEHYLVPDRVQAPVMLRMMAGEISFDPDWSRSFTEELGTRFWGNSFPGPDGSVYFLALDDELPEIEDVEITNDFSSIEGWKWYRLDGFDADFEETTIDAGFIGGFAFFADKEYYVQRFNEADETYTLFKTTAPGGLKEGLTTPGFSYSMLRVR